MKYPTLLAVTLTLALLNSSTAMAHSGGGGSGSCSQQAGGANIPAGLVSFKDQVQKANNSKLTEDTLEFMAKMEKREVDFPLIQATLSKVTGLAAQDEEAFRNTFQKALKGNLPQEYFDTMKDRYGMQREEAVQFAKPILEAFTKPGTITPQSYKMGEPATQSAE